jgi:hypothetical protein
MVNRDQMEELRDYLGEHGSMPGKELAQWLLMRKRGRFTDQLRAVMWKMPRWSPKRTGSAGAGCP